MSSAPCLQGILIAGPATATAGRIEICTEIARQVPELQVAVDKLLKEQATSGDRLKEIERLLVNLNAAGSKVDTRAVTLARSVAEQLGKTGEKSAAAAMREIRGLSDRLEEVVERLDAASRDRQKADAVRSGLAGPIGEAVAALDLERANRMIDELSAIREQVSQTNTQIEGLRSEARLRDALNLVLEASRAAARGEIGQTAALELLISAEREFDNSEFFQGVAFRNGRLSKLRAPRANLKYADLSGSDLSGAMLEDASLQAINAVRSRFDASDLAGARLPIVVATEARFDKSKLDRTAWFASSLQRVSFRDASLRGASFLLADLRGANFAGADLTNVSFNGADLRGADFSGATVSNTDFAFALYTPTQLTTAQKAGACAGLRGHGGIAFVMVLPDPVPYGTKKYLDIDYRSVSVSWDAPGAGLQQCAAAAPAELPEIYDVRTDRAWPFRIHLPQHVAEAGRNRGDLMKRLATLLGSNIIERVKDARSMGWKVHCPFAYGWGCEELVQQGIVAKD